MGRIACLLAADFPIAALVRSNPELHERPAAISASPASHAELTAVSPQARAAGIRTGMTAARARAIVPDLIVTRRSGAAERSAFNALLDVAESIAPLVEAGDSGYVWLDLAGCARFFDHANRGDSLFAASSAPGHSPQDTENAIAAELLRRARRAGLEVSVGVAANKEIAAAAAQCGGIRVIAPGTEREFLNWIPIEMVLDHGGRHGAGGHLEPVLARWGIRRLGDLARLDIRALTSRLGPQGLELARLARGESTTPFVARPRAELFTEKIELDYGVENLAALGFVMRAMLERLAARLELRGLRAGDITLEFGLADRSRNQRRVAVAAATLEVRPLLTLLNLSLEAAPPAAAIETVTITVQPRIPRPAQAGMCTPPTPAPDRLETTLARLAALCGPDHVGILRPHGSWRPEAVELAPFTPPRPVAAPDDPPQRNVTRLAIRAIRPAEAVEVMCDRDTPEFVRGQTLAARVVSIAGPWRRDGEWWNGAADGFARDYYDFALADGAVYRAYRDLRSGRWFVDGIYD